MVSRVTVPVRIFQETVNDTIGLSALAVSTVNESFPIAPPVPFLQNHSYVPSGNAVHVPTEVFRYQIPHVYDHPLCEDIFTQLFDHVPELQIALIPGPKRHEYELSALRFLTFPVSVFPETVNETTGVPFPFPTWKSAFPILLFALFLKYHRYTFSGNAVHEPTVVESVHVPDAYVHPLCD